MVSPLASAQCVTPISSFPYLEDFESDNGGWIVENNQHWNWGTPSGKPVITSAASGSKCWLAGSLTSSFYNSGSSYVTSPCFDISSLAHPEVSFHAFWETERRFDGACLLYSVDNGNSWQLLGSVNSDSNCEGSSWYNQNSINYLGYSGWSGSIQPQSGSCQTGGGSGEWVLARHSLEHIGASVIMFRFDFGAGTICNDFDGFAFDDFSIHEAAPNVADFVVNCTGNLTTTFVPSIQGCIENIHWDFGDPASGSNVSDDTSPTHQFSSGGNYTVTLTVSFHTGADVTTQKNISVIDVDASVLQPLRCSGDQNGVISLTTTPAGNYDVVWNTSPPQTTFTISSLAAGNYVAVVSGNGVCASTVSVALSEPPPVQISITKEDAFCGNNNGSLSAIISGGTSPYQLTWNTGNHSANLANIPPGDYQLSVMDDNGCTAQSPLTTIVNIQRNIQVNLGRDTSICPGQTIELQPGNYSSYLWQNGTTGSTFTVSQTGNYAVTVTDSKGCSGQGAIHVLVDCPDVYFPNAFTPNGDGLNNGFGPIGGISAISDYRLQIYGRWGELIFSSTNPFDKWDGTYKNIQLSTGTYTWYSSYRWRGTMIHHKGTVIIIR